MNVVSSKAFHISRKIRNFISLTSINDIGCFVCRRFPFFISLSKSHILSSVNISKIHLKSCFFAFFCYNIFKSFFLYKRSKIVPYNNVSMNKQKFLVYFIGIFKPMMWISFFRVLASLPEGQISSRSIILFLIFILIDTFGVVFASVYRSMFLFKLNKISKNIRTMSFKRFISKQEDLRRTFYSSCKISFRNIILFLLTVLLFYKGNVQNKLGLVVIAILFDFFIHLTSNPFSTLNDSIDLFCYSLTQSGKNFSLENIVQLLHSKNEQYDQFDAKFIYAVDQLNQFENVFKDDFLPSFSENLSMAENIVKNLEGWKIEAYDLCQFPTIDSDEKEKLLSLEDKARKIISSFQCDISRLGITSVSAWDSFLQNKQDIFDLMEEASISKNLYNLNKISNIVDEKMQSIKDIKESLDSAAKDCCSVLGKLTLGEKDFQNDSEYILSISLKLKNIKSL